MGSGSGGWLDGDLVLLVVVGEGQVVEDEERKRERGCYRVVECRGEREIYGLLRSVVGSSKH